VLNGVKLEKDRGGQYYGNIGRCLQFQGRVDDALIVFRKSAILLETQDGEMGKLNRGYIRFWLGEVLAVRGSRELAKVFLTAAYYQWQRFAPPRAKKVLAALAKIDPELSLPRGADSHEQSEAERKVRAWLKS
jgi:tetratricopeptide (TPR) repeat protein